MASSKTEASHTKRRELSIHGLGLHGDWELMLWHDRRLLGLHGHRLHHLAGRGMLRCPVTPPQHGWLTHPLCRWRLRSTPFSFGDFSPSLPSHPLGNPFTCARGANRAITREKTLLCGLVL